MTTRTKKFQILTLLNSATNSDHPCSLDVLGPHSGEYSGECRKMLGLQQPVECAIITCRICFSEKPCDQFPRSPKFDYTGSFSKLRDVPGNSVPDYCTFHLAVNPENPNNAVCNECISMHLVARMDNYGAERVKCIEPDCENDWKNHALNFLPSTYHEEYYQQLFDAFWSSVHKWDCPVPECDSRGMFTSPRDTPGFPHVECFGCKQRFCGHCRVPWHKGQTCQAYRAEHPEVESDDEFDQTTLRELAESGARRCPRCQYVIVKDGGCNSIDCRKCNAMFDFATAERVIPRSGFVDDDGAGNSNNEYEEDDEDDEEDEDEDEEEDEDSESNGEAGGYGLFQEPCEIDG